MDVNYTKAGSLKVGGYVLIDGAPCRVVSIEKSKPGKHGSAKARVVAVGLFDDKKRTLLKPVDAEVEVPVIKRSNAQVLAVVGESLQLMDLKTYETFYAPLYTEESLNPGDEVEYIAYNGEVKIVRKKG